MKVPITDPTPLREKSPLTFSGDSSSPPLWFRADLIHEIELGDGQTTYDPNFVDHPNHNHLICVDCGKVVEFEDSHLHLQNDCLTRRLGFRPVRQSLRIEAACERLRNGGSCPDLIQARVRGKRLPNRKK
ncbi:transcriptional repressor [bacterium]|nr:transcriptional repressor [bacterium]